MALYFDLRLQTDILDAGALDVRDKKLDAPASNRVQIVQKEIWFA
jgi:hypothetical protein